MLEERVFHIMGEAGEMRHLVVKQEQAIPNPSWSIHCGIGAAFIWAMAGENLNHDDMDQIPMDKLKINHEKECKHGYT